MNAAHVINGVTIRQNQYSAAWRRLWWVTDIGRNDNSVRCALVEASGNNPDDFGQWTPAVSFPSLRAARNAIEKATAA